MGQIQARQEARKEVYLPMNKPYGYHFTNLDGTAGALVVVTPESFIHRKN
jgi:16S rRNA U516 pseudouridylate synthase RsuA-like enzyme